MAQRNLVAFLVLSAASAVVLFACGDDDAATPTVNADSGTATSDGSTDSGQAGDSGGGGGGGGDAGGDAALKTAAATITSMNDSGVTGTASFTESSGGVTLTVSITGAPEGSRGTHLHVNADCSGGHFNPNPSTKNGEFDPTVVNDAGMGTGTSTRQGLTIEPKSDGGTGIIGRAIAIHGSPLLELDGGPVLTDAGTPAPPPVIGCGEVK